MVSGQLSNGLSLLNQFVVLTDYTADNTPFLSTCDGAVSKVGKSTNDTVCTDNGLFRFDYDWFFVPYEWFLKYFEDLLVDDRCLDTGNSPLMFCDQKRCHRVLNSH